MFTRSNRPQLDSQLNILENSLLDLSSMVEKAVNGSLEALKRRNHSLARQVIAADTAINARRYEIETDALYLLALQQPLVSRDLRYIAAVMNIAGELERMGDYAKGIARISDKLSGELPLGIMLHLEQMGQQSNKMLHDAMSAFIDRDLVLADRVANEDDRLDELYNTVYKELLALMFADNTQVDPATLLLWAAHNLERLGDRVTNVCERIRFVETGVLSDGPGFHDVPAD